MIRGTFNRFRTGLRKTREGVVGGLRSMFGHSIKLDPETLDQIEELLISADMGVKSAVSITRNIETRLKEEGGEATLESVLGVIRADVKQILVTATPRVKPLTWDEEVGKKKMKRRGRTAAPSEPAAEAPVGEFPRVIFVVGRVPPPAPTPVVPLFLDVPTPVCETPQPQPQAGVIEARPAFTG